MDAFDIDTHGAISIAALPPTESTHRGAAPSALAAPLSPLPAEPFVHWSALPSNAQPSCVESLELHGTATA